MCACYMYYKIICIRVTFGSVLSLGVYAWMLHLFYAMPSNTVKHTQLRSWLYCNVACRDS